MPPPPQVRLRVRERKEGEWSWVLFRVDRSQTNRVRYIDYGTGPTESLAREAGTSALMFWVQFGINTIDHSGGDDEKQPTTDPVDGR